VHAAAAWRESRTDRPADNGNGNQRRLAEFAAADAVAPVAVTEQAPGVVADQGEGIAAAAPAPSGDALTARLSLTPHYDFETLLAWLADGSGEALDPLEIRRRWARVAAANYGIPADDLERGGAPGWQRLVQAMAAASAGNAASAQFAGLGGSAPALDTFQGLSEGLQRL
jgi:hypothetical protein